MLYGATGGHLASRRLVFSDRPSNCIRSSGGRAWWAHLDFTRMNIALTILQNQIEEFSQLDVGRSCFDEAEISPSGPHELCVDRTSRMRFTSSPP